VHTAAKIPHNFLFILVPPQRVTDRCEHAGAVPILFLLHVALGTLSRSAGNVNEADPEVDPDE
jgi:hypothetical protein